ncbi:MAG: hypothetical protein AB8B53_13800 [Flavobacteriales bacterium]
MSTIKELISLLNPGERASFIQFLDHRNKRHDTRNIQLFKAHLKNSESSIRSEIGSNAFNALNKRLTDLLIDFTATKTLSSSLSEENSIIKLVVTARKLISNASFKEGMLILKKAEKLALALDQHSLLNEIYHTSIEHAHRLEQVDLELLFSKLKKNNEQFIAQEKLGVLYAKMHREFLSGKFHHVPSKLKETLGSGLKTFDINPELILNYRSLNQLCSLTDLYASQTKSYSQADLFFEKHIATLKGTEKDTEKMLPYHIELLYTMANIYFRKRNFKRSKFYLINMKEQMERFPEVNQSVWKGRYTNLLALNLNFSAQYGEALDIIQTRLKERNLTQPEKALLTLTLCMIHFQQECITSVKSALMLLNRTDQFYLNHLGNEWLFNFKAIEILMHYELGNDLLAESRIKSFKRKYGQLLKADSQNPIWPFLKLIQIITIDYKHITSPEFTQKVEETIPWKGVDEDFFNICFYAWLKAKMLKRPIYSTTLNLVGTEEK